MALSLTEVGEFLGGRFKDPISELEMLKGGDWSEAFGFVVGDKPLVIRFGAHRADFDRDRMAFRFNGPNLPVPEVLEIGEGPTGFICISHRVHGEMIDRLDGIEFQAMIPSVLGLLDALRLADSSAWANAFGSVDRTWHERLMCVDEENDRVFGWHDKMAASSMGADAYRTGLKFLKDNLASLPDRSDLLHNDLLHNNVLVDNRQISGVIDWGCADLGDFVYELASFTLYQPWHSGMRSIDWALEAKRHYLEIGLDVPDFESRLTCYEVHLALSGLGYSAFRDNWTDFEAVAKRMLERMP
jgi:aminoglycoside phosphotransferase